MDRDEAELAVLEVALAEHAGRAARDLWPAVERALRAPTPATPVRRRSGLLVAALMLLGALVVGATMWARREQPPTVTTAPLSNGLQDGLPTGPRDLPELLERLERADEATLETQGIWSPTLGRWVDIERTPLDALMTIGTRPRLDRDQLAEIVAAMRTATVDGRDVRRICWTHSLSVTGRVDGSVLLLRVGGGDEALLAFRSPDGPVPLACAGFPFADLQADLDDVDEKTLDRLNLVIGPGAFAARAADSQSLRLIDVPAGDVAALQRFPELRRVDLRRAPEWHAASVLAQLPATIEHLAASPHWLRRDGYRALADLSALRDLLVMDGTWVTLLQGKAASPAPGLDDAAVEQLAQCLSLRELTLAGGCFGDGALRALHAVPLRRLYLADCAEVHGSSLSGFQALDGLLLQRCALQPEVVAQLATLPALSELRFDEPGCEVPLAPLGASPSLQDLAVRGSIRRDELPLLAACPQLERLELDPSPPLRADELSLLHGLGRLKRLTIVGLGEAERAQLAAALPGCRVKSEN